MIGKMTFISDPWSKYEQTYSNDIFCLV